MWRNQRGVSDHISYDVSELQCCDWLISALDKDQSWAIWSQVCGLGERLIQKVKWPSGFKFLLCQLLWITSVCLFCHGRRFLARWLSLGSDIDMAVLLNPLAELFAVLPVFIVFLQLQCPHSSHWLGKVQEFCWWSWENSMYCHIVQLLL